MSGEPRTIIAQHERAPRAFDVPVCRECRQPIPHGAPKVSSGGGWLCAPCVYELERAHQ